MFREQDDWRDGPENPKWPDCIKKRGEPLARPENDLRSAFYVVLPQEKK